MKSRKCCIHTRISAAVEKIERENIRTQAMAGREQKTKQEQQMIKDF